MEVGVVKKSLAQHVRTLIWALLSVGGLAACGGGGGGGGSNPGEDLSSRHYLPAAVGDRWFYTDSTKTDPVRVRATATVAVGGQSGVVLRTDDSSQVVLVEDASGIRQVPTANSDSLTAAIGPQQLLRYPLTVGDSFTSVDKSLGAVIDFDGDGIGDPASVRSEVRVIELADLSTPLGRLPDCLHVRTTLSITVQLVSQNRTVELTETDDDWLAAGIGIVRSVQAISAGAASETRTLEISAYAVGALRSESRPPVATAPTLASGSALGPSTIVEILFDEDMDEGTLAGALTVLDAAGRAVVGTVASTPRAIRFTPTAPWASGGFSARLAATAADIVGNPVAATRWGFTIDATAPSVVGTRPLEGAVDVPLASAIELTFSEPVLPSSVNEGTISALYDGAAITLVSYQVAGTKVTLTPRTPLARGKPYSILIQGVTDAAGNAVATTELRFTTDPGRFGAPTRLPSPLADMTIGPVAAIGDVDGDGLRDVVAGTSRFVGGTIGWESQLAIYAQQQAGGLPATPVLVSLQPGASVIGIVIADIDLDGRNDVVVSQGSLGVEIFRQGVNGQLLAGTVVNTGTTSQMQLADMNGDGRPDIVSYGANVVSVWLNLSGGWSQADAVTVTTYAVARDLAIGDLNSDGRPDVLFVGQQMPNFAAAGLLLQAANGSLGAPQWIHYGSNETAFSAAVGDADGDGRADVLLSFATGLALASQQANGTLGALTAIDSATFPGAPKLADINGDGRVDIVTLDSSGTLVTRLRNDDGTWAAPASYPGNWIGSAPGSQALAVGDISGDGRPDVVASGSLFTQRSVPVMSQFARPALPPPSTGSVLARLRAVLARATMQR